MRSETRAPKSSSRQLAKSYLLPGLAAVFFLVLLTYFSASSQAPIFDSNAFSSAPPSLKEKIESFGVDASSFQNREDEKESEGSHELGDDRLDENEEHEITTNRERVDSEISVHERKQPEHNPVDGEAGRKNDVPPFNFYDAQKESKSDEQHRGERDGRLNQHSEICNQSNPKFDACDFGGDIRAIGSSKVVLLVPPVPNSAPPHEWKIKPYSRKYVEGLNEVTVKALSNPQEAPPCSTTSDVPGLIIHLGGFSGNYWHDFTDILIPLFVRSRQFGGELQLLITYHLPFWVSKYEAIFKALSRYEVVNFDSDHGVRCYRQLLVGFGSNKEFSIDPSQTINGYTMTDFTKFLRTTYSLPRDQPIKLRDSPGKKPRLMLVARGGSRKFVNIPDIVQLAAGLGFDVAVVEQKGDVQLADFARTVNSFDVMLGAHGAGLTNCLFLPTGAVFIQVVPYGHIEHIAKTDFGDPAVDMELKYLEYSISAEESTLFDVFGKDHPLIKDPIAIHMSGWGNVAEWYLGKQDIKIDTTRFAPVLLKARELLL